jgi:hypothetical protein
VLTELSQLIASEVPGSLKLQHLIFLLHLRKLSLELPDLPLGHPMGIGFLACRPFPLEKLKHGDSGGVGRLFPKEHLAWKCLSCNPGVFGLFSWVWRN